MAILSILKLLPCFFALFLANSPCMLDVLGKRLREAPSALAKMAILDSLSSVDRFFQAHPRIAACSASLSDPANLALKAIIAAGQAERVMGGVDDPEKLGELLTQLIPVDHFYREMGGIVGYQAKILELSKGAKEEAPSDAEYHSPAFIDIAEETPAVQEAIEWGLRLCRRWLRSIRSAGRLTGSILSMKKRGLNFPPRTCLCWENSFRTSHSGS